LWWWWWWCCCFSGVYELWVCDFFGLNCLCF
jgi:hypothetical protein